MGTTFGDIAHDEFLYEQAREDEYQLLLSHFKIETAEAPLNIVRARIHEILLELRTSLARAIDHLEDGASMDDRFTAFAMAFRTIDYVDSEVLRAFLRGFTQPFEQYFDDFENLKHRNFFNQRIATALTRAALNQLLRPDAIGDIIGAYFKKFAQVRHKVVHELYFPSLDEARSCALDAIVIYNKIDASINPLTTAPIVQTWDV